MRPNPDPVAEHARRCVAATLEVDVEHWDQGGRQRAHDLRYLYDGRVVAVEVKLVVKPAYRAASQVASEMGYTLDDRLSRLWHLRLEHDASWKRVRESAPPMLRKLELTGWEYFPLWRLRDADRLIYERLKR